MVLVVTQDCGCVSSRATRVGGQPEQERGDAVARSIQVSQVGCRTPAEIDGRLRAHLKTVQIVPCEAEFESVLAPDPGQVAYTLIGGMGSDGYERATGAGDVGDAQ